MDITLTSTSILSIALGIGLAAATGFRVFLPLVAAGETVGALGISILAIAVPMLCMILVLALLIWIVRRILRFFRSRQATQKNS